MLAKLHSVAVTGVEAHLLDVEVDLSQGLPGTTIVGLPDTAVKEAKDRVKAAVNNSGYQFPVRKLTINLAPADIRKEGPCFDLPIALGTLMAAQGLFTDEAPNYALVGELSLEGALRPVRGALSMAIAARQAGLKGMLLPKGNASEASVVDGLDIIPVDTLVEAVGFLSGECPIEPCRAESFEFSTHDVPLDFADVRGQEHAKRALLVAAAGAHNVLMIGSPGSGKTMMAQRLSGILPPLTLDESLETTRVHSVAGLLSPGSGLVRLRPVRSPHHTVSDVGLIGGGANPRPGEISLANHGVLFLDELPEFQRRVLEVLRQPLEDGRVSICRAQGSVTYPAEFLLVASMNPCPCGWHGCDNRECLCAPGQIDRYVGRLSGPLLDRIDLHIEVDSVPPEKLTGTDSGESSARMRDRVCEARSRQQKRFRGTATRTNSRMTVGEVREHCRLNGETELLMTTAMKSMGLSARAYHRILKVARTLADLEGIDDIGSSHVAEAIGCRTLDRRLWMP